MVRHVREMDKSCVSQQVFFYELSEGKRHQGRPLFRYTHLDKVECRVTSVLTFLQKMPRLKRAEVWT
uniref:Uncharacterized protein n=1 Tax=Arion vulgaris TaxID=1028688 RepID=A0A0B7BMY2_9EUPU